MPKSVKGGRKSLEPEVVAEPPPSMGISPAVLANRDKSNTKSWCPTADVEFDALCDSDNPKTILFKDVKKATDVIKEYIEVTPLKKSRACKKMGMELYLKYENLHHTGSFHERAALYALRRCSTEQRYNGVITASLGNWGMALSYYGHLMNIRVIVVLPVNTKPFIIDRCQAYGGLVVINGENFAEAKRHAFTMISEYDTNKPIYINGYDHPHVIAANGSISVEIMEQLPEVDVIMVPVGGGALIAGIAVAIKEINPAVQIYGVQSDKCCSFFKAMDRDGPYLTHVDPGLANTLAIPIAGSNSFHTAKSLINKMVLVDDDWIAQGMSFLVEEENLVAEGGGAVALGALLAFPEILPELKGKKIVCIISGGNVDSVTIIRSFERAKCVDGRLMKFSLRLPSDHPHILHKLFNVISSVGGNVLYFDTDYHWVNHSDVCTDRIQIVVETKNIDHACTLKKVVEQLFPEMCEFQQEPFSPIPLCACYPKKRHHQV